MALYVKAVTLLANMVCDMSYVDCGRAIWGEERKCMVHGFAGKRLPLKANMLHTAFKDTGEYGGKFGHQKDLSSRRWYEMKPAVEKGAGITWEHAQRLYQVYWWLMEAGDEYTEQAEILRDIYLFLKNMLDVEAGIEQGYLDGEGIPIAPKVV